eukprot:gene20027-39618_t
MKILGGDLEPSAGNVALDVNERLGKLRQDQFAYEEMRVLDVVMMGHTEMWAAMQERDAIYANPDATDGDYVRAAELEGKVSGYDGYTAGSRAGELLLGAGVGSTGFDSVLNARSDPVAWQILWDIRLPRTLGAWAAGALLGLAGLAKYTAVFTALALGLVLLWVHGLRLLRKPWLWVALALAVVLVLPVLVWNAQHQWASFVYQLAHGKGSQWQVLHVLRFGLLQLLAFGPLLLAAAWARGARTARWLWAAFVLPF